MRRRTFHRKEFHSNNAHKSSAEGLAKDESMTMQRTIRYVSRKGVQRTDIPNSSKLFPLRDEGRGNRLPLPNRPSDYLEDFYWKSSFWQVIHNALTELN
ncbi:hypothetical protein CDAR_299911 [Caerostris darwini]|uniref:Uncharacterized protein n=1 Tax=Caerostris darwini TaxID=1538125 RepID=A0AAV4W2X9_9ARAC|nr:hypothetical protein CDAR_299911 [Caerostris darwini]